MEPYCKPEPPSHEAARAHIKKMFNIEDTSGLDLFVTLHRVAHISEALENQLSEDMELSGPRMRLMIRLLAEEQMGNPDGLTPTVLSHFHRVSKNTISALLRGLEEQGLIQRNLDSDDLRVFRIQLTDAGRELVLKTAPRRIAGMNKMLSGLEPEEQKQLVALLEKLQQALLVHVHHPEKENQ